MKSSRLAVFAVVLSGCATTRFEPQELPAAMDAFFVSCGGLDGAGELRISENGSESASPGFDYEWVSAARAPYKWKVFFSGPFGKELGSIERDDTDLKLTGASAFTSRFPELSVNSRGELLGEGYRSGLLADELPCVLALRLPSRWSRSVRDIQSLPRGGTFDIVDAGREIHVSFSSSQRSVFTEFCARITWREWLGLRSRETVWCAKREPRLSGSLVGLGGMGLNWVVAPDG